jgi:hypothetical protein
MFADYCIYTMRHSTSLAEDARRGNGELVERAPWVTGSRLFGEASASGLRLPIVFSAADIDSGLIYYATITDVVVEDADDGGRRTTRCTYEAVQPIDPPRHLSELTLATGKPLSDQYIRPYAICRTPSFIG